LDVVLYVIIALGRGGLGLNFGFYSIRLVLFKRRDWIRFKFRVQVWWEFFWQILRKNLVP